MSAIYQALAGSVRRRFLAVGGIVEALDEIGRDALPREGRIGAGEIDQPRADAAQADGEADVGVLRQLQAPAPALRRRARKRAGPTALSTCAAGRLSENCSALRAVTEP